MDKPIILIGGTAGTGKTTLARDISNLLNIDHRIGTGFIREILRSQSSNFSESYLFDYTFSAQDPTEIVKRQANRLLPAVLSCIYRARNEGTSLIIEGNHILPELYSRSEVDRFYVLKPTADHKSMVHGTTHLKRHVSEDDFLRIQLIDNYLYLQAKQYNIPYVTAYDCKELILHGKFNQR